MAIYRALLYFNLPKELIFAQIKPEKGKLCYPGLNEEKQPVTLKDLILE